MNISYSYIVSPLGRLLLIANENALTNLYLENHKWACKIPSHAREEKNDVIALGMQQLQEYFEKKRQDFTVPLQPHGTEFQLYVWNALRQIPFGTTTTYSAFATAMNKTKATRAVGLANGKNPISILIPCHRVLGANGSLTGYAGGLACKQWLLEHEQRDFYLHPPA